MAQEPDGKRVNYSDTAISPKIRMAKNRNFRVASSPSQRKLLSEES